MSKTIKTLLEYQKMTPSELAKHLGTSYGKIKYFYYENNIESHYEIFLIPKKNGSHRNIKAPSKQLKELQNRLKFILDEIYTPKDPAKAFIKNKSIYDNAKPHTSKHFVFNVDLKDFFDSITFPRIRGMLIAPPYNFQPETATVIAHLCTVNGSTPQGAPTSPTLSNMICTKLDSSLIKIAKKYNCTYTRYADDITFSFSCPEQYLPEGIVRKRTTDTHYSAIIGDELEKAILENNFSINNRKTRLQNKHERQVVTGLTVNRKVNINRKYIRKTSAIIHSLEMTPPTLSDYHDRNLTERHAHGRLLFIKQIRGENDTVYNKMAIRFNLIAKITRAPTSKPINSSDNNIRYAEFFSSRCWVLESDENLSQASGFMIEDNIIITCAHFLRNTPENPIKECIGYLPGSQLKKFILKVFEVNEKHDIAILKFESEQDIEHPHFKIASPSGLAIGQKISVLGFPNFKNSSTQVSRYWANITNFCVISMNRMAEIDKNIYSGNSGGPVIDEHLNVIGIAARGADENTHHNAFILIDQIEELESLKGINYLNSHS